MLEIRGGAGKAKLSVASGVSQSGPSSRADEQKPDAAMKTILFSLILIVIVPAPVAMGRPSGAPREDSGRDPAMDERGRQARFASAWEAADKDGDGFISRQEFDLMPRISRLPDDKRPMVFARLDKDGDGRLGREELARPDRHPGGPRPPMPRMRELDTDQSGGVSFEEFKAGPMFQKLPAERQMVIFRRLDTDADGEITPADRPMPPPKPEHGGTPPRRSMEQGSGKGPGAGGPSNPLPMIRRLDRDGDGVLSFEEFRAGPLISTLDEDAQEDRFEALDKNGDQQISPEDFPAGSNTAKPESLEMPATR
jgi:Ca2+-binding EF-hand superfamily protein